MPLRKMNKETISDFVVNGKEYIVQRKDDVFQVVVLDEKGNRVVQPDHDSVGVIRYMANIIYNQNHIITKNQ